MEFQESCDITSFATFLMSNEIILINPPPPFQIRQSETDELYRNFDFKHTQVTCLLLQKLSIGGSLYPSIVTFTKSFPVQYQEVTHWSAYI